MVVCGALAPLFVGAAIAEAVSVNTCLAGKLSDVGGAVMARAACQANDAKQPNAVVLASCLAKAERRFDGGEEPALGRFAKRERRPPCLTNDDQVAFAVRVAQHVDGVAAAVAPSGAPNACDAAALTCVGRHRRGLMLCLTRAAKSTGAVDPRCLEREHVRLTDGERGCLRKAATRGVCSVTGNGASLIAGGATFAAQTLCALDPVGSPNCASLPTPAPTPTRTPTPTATRTPTPVPTPGENGDVAQLCVDTINQYRASIGRPPYARWTAAEVCADDEAYEDSQSGTPHGAFNQCGEWAQNECPGWNGPAESMIGNCLAVMWAEGPGSDFATHGHYINMASTSYTKVACGFSTLPNGRVWAVQDFQ